MAAGNVSDPHVSNSVPQSSSKTDAKFFKFNHKWTIPNFAHCLMEPNEEIHSRIFGSEVHDMIRWRLTLDRRGEGEGSENNFGLYLERLSSFHNEITVTFKFWILDSTGQKKNLYEDDEPTPLKAKSFAGCDNYFSIDDLTDEKDGLLPDGHLTIYCEITASATNPSGIKCIQDTEEDPVELSYMWVIDDFSLLKGKMGEFISSPVFFSPASREIKWRLVLYPNGDSIESQSHISLFLKPASINEKNIDTLHTYSLINSGIGRADFEQRAWIQTFPMRQSSGFGSRKFVEKRLMLDEANGWLSNDKLTILCEIAYSAKHRDDYGDDDPTIPAIPACRLSRDLEILFATKKLSDVTLVVGKRKMQAHKAVLAARSSVFSAMFEREMQERKSNRVVITDVEYEVLEEMLRFVYTGKVNQGSDMSTKLFKAADKYDLQELKAICEQELCSNVTVENATVLLMLAHAHSAKSLMTAVIGFIAKERVAVTSGDDFKSLAECYPQFICELFHRLSALEEILRFEQDTTV